MEALGVLAVYQLDEFQAEDVVHAQALRQLLRGVLLAGTDTAVVQLVGEDDVIGLRLRAILQEVAQLRQVYAPLHVEYQQAQGVRRLCGGGGDIVDLRLGELGDAGHDLGLGCMVQQRAQALPFLVGKSLHGGIPP